MAGKEFPLSIVIRTVDKATAGIRKINDRIDKLTSPVRQLGTSLKGLGKQSGLSEVVTGFKGVGGALKTLLGHLALVAGAAGAAVLGLKSMVDTLDNLGDTAERIGITADSLAQLRFAAELSGASVEALDGGLQTFSKGLGQLSAGTGKLKGFLEKVSPALLAQVKGAKSSGEAFGLLADAMAKVKDPAKRAALAAAAFGGAGAELAPLLAQGSKGIDKLKQRYASIAGSQEGAVKTAGKLDDAFKDLGAATDGVKAALVEGLGPAFLELIEKVTAWFQANREEIAQWVTDFGKKLPGAVEKVVKVFDGVMEIVTPIWDAIGGLSGAAVILAAVLGGPLILSLAKLSIALLTTPVGWVLLGIAALIAIGVLLVKNWDKVGTFFSDLWLGIKQTFSDVIDWIVADLMKFEPIALIVNNWGRITEFFKGVWDGVTAVFVGAWEIIKGIVDKIIWAVDKVKEGIGAIIDFVGGGGGGGGLGDFVGGERPSLGASIAAATGKPGATSEAHVKIDFANAPKGTRVTTDPRSTADVDLSVGYQMVMP